MGRKNYLARTKPNEADTYELDYVVLTDYPQINKIIAIPLRTIYVNLAANFDGTLDYTAKCEDDPMLRYIGRARV